MNSICHETASGEGLSEREVELQATVTRLEALCSQVAHDLRDSLSGISSLAEISYTALEERQDCRSALRSLALIAQQAHRSRKMLNGILRLAQTRDAALQLGRVDVQVVAEQVAQEMAVCHGDSMPHVWVRPMPIVVADADLLHAVLFNLINNAVKFTRERSNARIEVDAITSDEATVTVCVRDNGVGFDAARADELFKPFSRLHGANYEGCGIGLSIVHRAVKRLRGRVWTDATPGQGARFFFTLPLGLADDGQFTHRDRQSDSTTSCP